MTALVDGETRPSGDHPWEPARFALRTSGEPTLLVQGEDDDTPTEYPLGQVTGLDELLGAPEGRMHVEVVNADQPSFEANWSEQFADEIVAALLATVPAPDPTSEAEITRTEPKRTPAAVIAALAVAGVVAVVVGAVGLSRSDDGPPTTRPEITCEQGPNCPPGE